MLINYHKTLINWHQVDISIFRSNPDFSLSLWPQFGEIRTHNYHKSCFIMFAFWSFLTNLITKTTWTICCIFSRTWKNFWQTIFILNDAENDWAYFVKKLATFHRILAHFDGSKLTAEFSRLQLGKKLSWTANPSKNILLNFG